MSRANQYQMDLPSLPASRVAIRIRPQVINVLVDDLAPSYSFDRAGRLIGAFVDGVNYRRGLDNRVLAKWPDTFGKRQRRWLTREEASVLLDRAYAIARVAVERADDDRLSILSHWDQSALDSDAQRFASIYRPVSILPPDQYLSLVVQATIGCSYNHCTFCTFYRDREFRIKSADEFRHHLDEVKAFFGPSLSLRKSLFLADANALVAPMSLLRAWFDEIDRASLVRNAGIFSFMDAFNVSRKTTDEWRELKQRGLRRIYLGMETGDDTLLRFLRKPGTAADVIDAVSRVKSAGISASVIVMTGIGGDRFAADHIRATATALNAMPLGDGDIIYFSPFVSLAESEYTYLAADLGVTALSEEEVVEQEMQIRTRLVRGKAPHGPISSRYDIREFVY